MCTVHTTYASNCLAVHLHTNTVLRHINPLFTLNYVGGAVERAHLCCTPREHCLAFPHLTLCQGKKALFAFYTMGNKPAICFKTAEHSTAGTKGSNHRQVHRQVITVF